MLRGRFLTLLLQLLRLRLLLPCAIWPRVRICCCLAPTPLLVQGVQDAALRGVGSSGSSGGWWRLGLADSCRRRQAAPPRARVEHHPLQRHAVHSVVGQEDGQRVLAAEGDVGLGGETPQLQRGGAGGGILGVGCMTGCELSSKGQEAGFWGWVEWQGVDSMKKDA